MLVKHYVKSNNECKNIVLNVFGLMHIHMIRALLKSSYEKSGLEPNVYEPIYLRALI